MSLEHWQIFESDPQGLANERRLRVLLLFHPEVALGRVNPQTSCRQSRLDPQNCANSMRGHALSVQFEMVLIGAMFMLHVLKVHKYSCQSLANAAWMLGNAEVMWEVLAGSIPTIVRHMLHGFTGLGWRRRDLVAFALGLLGIAWAHAFLEVENQQLRLALQAALVQLGLRVDEIESSGQKFFSQPELEPEAVHGIFAKSPQLLLDLNGMIVIHKQPDWEVDGKSREDKDTGLDEGPPALSAWLRAKLPRSRYPITRDIELDYGFLHRLDVPSSGLILCGVTFSGLMSLRWQLDNYLIERQYAVWGHDLADSGMNEVSANIDPQTIDSRRSFTSEVRGKPAKSWFRVPAHFHIPSHNGFRAANGVNEFCSAFIVRIRTGRRHQIRAHMLSAGHPTVVDAKYAALQVVFLRLLDYEKGYLNSRCRD